MLSKISIAVIDAYKRWVSPRLGVRCRFSPTCSEYSRGVITRFGLVRGGFLALGRLCRCNPGFRGGYDPVPEAKGSVPVVEVRRGLPSGVVREAR